MKEIIGLAYHLLKNKLLGAVTIFFLKSARFTKQLMQR